MHRWLLSLTLLLSPGPQVLTQADIEEVSESATRIKEALDAGDEEGAAKLITQIQGRQMLRAVLDKAAYLRLDETFLFILKEAHGELDENSINDLFQKAIAFNLPRVVNELKAKFPKLVERNDEYQPMVLAAEYGAYDVAQQMLEENAPSDLVSAIELAIISGHVDVARLLLGNIELEALSRENKFRLLVAAAYLGHVPLVQVFVNSGADVNSLLPDKRHVLTITGRAEVSSYSKVFNHRVVFDLLVAHGANECLAFRMLDPKVKESQLTISPDWYVRRLRGSEAICTD